MKSYLDDINVFGAAKSKTKPTTDATLTALLSGSSNDPVVEAIVDAAKKVVAAAKGAPAAAAATARDTVKVLLVAAKSASGDSAGGGGAGGNAQPGGTSSASKISGDNNTSGSRGPTSGRTGGGAGDGVQSVARSAPRASGHRSNSHVLGDAGTGGAPSVDLDDFGPGSGGTHYTDSATIKSVQQALISKGFSVGKDGADGKFGPDTEAALYKFGGIHGPPDDAMLSRLGVSPVAAAPSRPVASSSAPSTFSAPSIFPSFAPAAPHEVKAKTPDVQAAGLFGLQWWQVGVVGVGGLAVVAGVVSLFVGGGGKK